MCYPIVWKFIQELLDSFPTLDQPSSTALASKRQRVYTANAPTEDVTQCTAPSRNLSSSRGSPLIIAKSFIVICIFQLQGLRQWPKRKSSSKDGPETTYDALLLWSFLQVKPNQDLFSTFFLSEQDCFVTKQVDFKIEKFIWICPLKAVWWLQSKKPKGSRTISACATLNLVGHSLWFAETFCDMLVFVLISLFQFQLFFWQVCFTGNFFFQHNLFIFSASIILDVFGVHWINSCTHCASNWCKSFWSSCLLSLSPKKVLRISDTLKAVKAQCLFLHGTMWTSQHFHGKTVAFTKCSCIRTESELATHWLAAASSIHFLRVLDGCLLKTSTLIIHLKAGSFP